jgi:sugar lactone lactonase YvrE
MVLSPENKTIWVAQIFSQVGPVILDGKLWAVELNADMSAGDARMVADLEAAGVKSKGADGLAIDEQGRVYIADNSNGRVLRYDSDDGTTMVIAEGMPNIASLVFGEGEFDHFSLYATTTFRGGGDIWRIPVGVRGLAVLRD